MAATDPPQPNTPYDIPKEGSLGLLALGYRGLVAWRAIRGTEWIEERRVEHEEIAKVLEARKAEEEKKKEEAAEKTAEEATEKKAPKRLAADVLEKLSVTLVSGLPRSGTSMMMQMLTSGGMEAFTDEAREADESNPRGYFEHERVKGLTKDSTWLADADGLVVKVVAPLLRYLPAGPSYKVVFMERGIEEILSSQSAMLDRDGRSSGERDVLKRAYERQLAEARAWCKHVNASVIEVQHRSAIENPASAAAAINEHLGGNLAEEPMTSVVDPSLHRERAKPTI